VKDTLQTLVESTKQTLLEGLTLIDSLDEAGYSATASSLGADSAGNHIRHYLEFFECFLDGLKIGAVDYASRRRDRAVGQDRLLGMLRTAETMERLDALRTLDSSAPISVRAEDDTEDAWMPSTLGRELEFLRSHTVHHYGLIALIVRMHGATVPSTFGVAPSTLRFQAEAPACAR